VWLLEGEVERMAARLGMEVEAFRRLHVRTVPDPGGSGELRETLRERQEGDGGRCTLLEGRNECSVYGDRPEHCRTFPYWPSVLETDAGFERAKATCPGLRAEPSEAVRKAAFEQLEAVSAALEALLAAGWSASIMRGVCSRLARSGMLLTPTGRIERWPCNT